LDIREEWGSGGRGVRWQLGRWGWWGVKGYKIRGGKLGRGRKGIMFVLRAGYWAFEIGLWRWSLRGFSSKGIGLLGVFSLDCGIGFV